MREPNPMLRSHRRLSPSPPMIDGGSLIRWVVISSFQVMEEGMKPPECLHGLGFSTWWFGIKHHNQEPSICHVVVVVKSH